MESAKTLPVNDEFGYQRFALTEAAYDLVNKLTAIYSRLSVREGKGELSESYAAKADQLQAGLSTFQWSDVSQLKLLVAQLSAEYKQIIRIESGQPMPNAAQPKRLQTI
ncbi:hypothetical protein [Fibrella arboris]|uniref:hypothetical protein n=1 Tax=Fibrella arboris TaxID=3242486 RepID=UPI00351FC342